MKRYGLFLLLSLAAAGAGHADAQNLPSRDAGVVVPMLRALPKPDTYDRVLAILGKPDMDVGSGLNVYLYTLSDLSQVTVSTNGTDVFYIGLIAHHRNLPIYSQKKA